ncbi:hypothetical protein [Reichenbachiella versicolor]|uniref:hypothetical protein n=1 Tax=Reichenbachiella versicolor TaxID=1821036 RepID=UPI000D6DF8A5|nr:hypothetical protein [Reichenbachiella versicolor]
MRVVKVIVLVSVLVFGNNAAMSKEKASNKDVTAIGSKTIKKQKIGQEATLDKFGDFDGDGIINLYDRCPCQSGKKTDTGCPDERTNLKIA